MSTVHDILQNEDKFGIPRLDLEILLASVLDCCRSKLYAHPEMNVPAGEFKKLAKKRKTGVPVAYLTNVKEFYGNKFYVDERVLIPRPETEMIIDEIEYDLKARVRFLDIGTGSGAIGLTLANKYPNSDTVMTDVCPCALEVAKINAERMDLDERTRFLETDLLDGVRGEFDVVTANLPYIPNDGFVCKHTLKHEPHQALFGGPDGLDVYRRLFEQLDSVVYKRLIGEFAYGQEKDLAALLAEKFDNYEIKKDLAGIPRIFIIYADGR